MSNTDFDIPVVLSSVGAVPTPPATLRADLVNAILAINPGFTANIPMSLVEDFVSTGTGNMAVMDTARIEAINSITPYGANNFVLAQLGQIYIGPGAAPAPPTNTSVTVQFTVTNTQTSTPQPGFLIGAGWTVSDGAFQYIVQDGGVTDSNGLVSLFCISPTTGVWAVAAGSVVNTVTQPPSPYAVACTNPLAGTTSQVAETAQQYRARVLQAGQAISQGMPTMLKTLLGDVGVPQRLISVQQQSAADGGGWLVIAGGGDPYQVGGAIYDALFDISTLVGSDIDVTGITQANPGVITTDINHGLIGGQTAEITGVVGMTQINGESGTVTVISEKSFSLGINTTGYSPWISGGIVTPNNRNTTVDIIDYPDIYSVTFVNPPQQTVTMTVTWQTTQPNFVGQASIAQAAAPAIADYINTIQAGNSPINLLEASQVFLDSIAGILLPSQVSVLNFTVLINGVSTPPQSGTQLVFGDPQSYFQAASSGINVVQAT